MPARENETTKEVSRVEFSAKEFLLSGWGVFLAVMGVVSVILDVVAIFFHTETWTNMVILAGGSFTLGWLVVVLLFVLPPLLVRKMRVVPISKWLAVLWVIVAIFGWSCLKGVESSFESGSAIRPSLSFFGGVVLCWRLLTRVQKREMPNADENLMSEVQPQDENTLEQDERAAPEDDGGSSPPVFKSNAAPDNNRACGTQAHGDDQVEAKPKRDTNAICWWLGAAAMWCVIAGFADFDEKWISQISQWALCAVCGGSGYYLWTNGVRYWLIPLALIGICFNPLAPIDFNGDEKQMVYWISAGALSVYASRISSRAGSLQRWWRCWKKRVMTAAVVVLIFGLIAGIIGSAVYLVASHRAQVIEQAERDKRVRWNRFVAFLTPLVDKYLAPDVMLGTRAGDTANPLLDVWGQPDYRDDHERAMDTWRQDSAKALDAAVLDSKSYTDERIPSLGEWTPEEWRKTRIVDDWMRLHTDGEEPPLGGPEREFTRARLAAKVFAGAGAESDDALVAEITKAALTRKSLRDCFLGGGTMEGAQRSLGLALMLAARDRRNCETTLREWIKVSGVQTSDRKFNQQLQEGSVFVYGEALKRRMELATVLQKISW